MTGPSAAKYLVDTVLANGATHTSIQAAINQAMADGYTGSNPTTILVRPGSYIGNVALAVGGAALITGVIVFVTAPRVKPAPVTVTPVVGSTGGALMVQGAF